MTPIKCTCIERNPGKTPPDAVPGSSWFATQVEHVPALGQWTTWALVPLRLAVLAVAGVAA